MYTESGQTSDIQVQPHAVTSEMAFKRQNFTLELERNVKLQKLSYATASASLGRKDIQYMPGTSSQAMEMKSNRSMIQSVSTNYY